MPELTPEQIKNMPPEQLAEMQKQNCPFCMIINGKIPSKKIYEDDVCMAILDINPANPGHVLVIPKEHFQIMPQVPDETLSRMTLVAKQISTIIFEQLGVQGTNVLIQNGPAADQRAPHFIIHVIPRVENDGMQFLWNPKKVEEAEMNQIFEKLTSKEIKVPDLHQQEAPKEPVDLDKEKEETKEEIKEDSDESSFLEKIP